MTASRPLLRAVAGLAALALTAGAVPEPDGIWTGPMIGDTPATLEGADVADVAALERLMPSQPVLVDSRPADRKPDTLPPGALWMPTHRSIPGARWFPGAGRGDIDEAKAQALLVRIGELAGGDKTRPIVTFCQPQCWGSWNVGKRLVAAGYTNVVWFPGGTNAWQERHETRAVEPEAGWEPNPDGATARIR